MGRRLKPASEQRMTGASKRRARSVELGAGVSDFPPPPWLTDREARSVWNRIAPELRRLNMLTPGDSDTFGRYCWHFAGFIRCLEQAPLGKEYVDVKMTNSEERMPRLHPAVKARELHERHLVDIEDRFGVSPLARYRLIAQQAAHPGAFGDLFNPKPAPTAENQVPGAAEPPPTSPIGVLQRPTAH